MACRAPRWACGPKMLKPMLSSLCPTASVLCPRFLAADDPTMQIHSPLGTRAYNSRHSSSRLEAKELGWKQKSLLVSKEDAEVCADLPTDTARHFRLKVV